MTYTKKLANDKKTIFKVEIGFKNKEELLRVTKQIDQVIGDMASFCWLDELNRIFKEKLNLGVKTWKKKNTKHILE